METIGDAAEPLLSLLDAGVWQPNDPSRRVH
jgi:hypothetical protein